MSTSYSHEMHPEIEAHLINSSDWIRRHGVMYLGCLSTVTTDKDGEKRIDNYALYAIPDGVYVQFGAHYGDNLWEYISGDICLTDKFTRHISASPPIATAITRYLLMTRG